MASVTVGLPVRNGADYLERALSSLVQQTHSDISIVISDNASTDETSAICRLFAERDGRIKYRRLETNIGMIANMNALLLEANSPYFMWAAHDDEWDPEYIERCLARLLANRAACSAMTGVTLIDADGVTIETVTSDFGFSSTRASDRVGAIVARPDKYLGYGFYGLHRHDAAMLAGPLFEGFGTDVYFTFRLALSAQIEFLPSPMFRFRLREDTRAIDDFPTVKLGDRPVTRLYLRVWKELGGLPHREAARARARLVRSLFRADGAWRRMLRTESAEQLVSAVAERRAGVAIRSACVGLLLDPLAPFRPGTWSRINGSANRRSRLR